MTTPPPLDNPPWGFIEWAITALSGAILTVVGYIMRTNGKLSTHTTLINHQSDLLDVVVDDVKEIKDKLAIRPTHEDNGKSESRFLIWRFIVWVDGSSIKEDEWFIDIPIPNEIAEVHNITTNSILKISEILCMVITNE